MGHALRLTAEQVAAHKKRIGGDAIGPERKLGTAHVVPGRAHPVKTRAISEHASQVQVIDWWSVARHKWLLPEYALFAVPNGGHRDVITGARLKSEGVRRGIPDLMLAVVTEVAPGLYLEMKAGKNKPSPEQVQVIDYLRRQGYHVCICYSSQEAVTAINGYLGAYAV